MTKKIIAFGHQKFTGKDTLAKFCIDVLRPKLRGKRIVRRGFADRVYDICHLCYAWAGFQPRTYYVDHPYAKNNVLANGKTVRQLLIDIGTPVMRAYDDGIWINAALQTDDFDILLISDLRFPNEFEAVEKIGGTLIKVSRPGLPEPTDIADTALNGWDDRWHDLVENNDGLNKLHAEAERIVDRYILTR